MTKLLTYAAAALLAAFALSLTPMQSRTGATLREVADWIEYPALNRAGAFPPGANRAVSQTFDSGWYSYADLDTPVTFSQAKPEWGSLISARLEIEAELATTLDMTGPDGCCVDDFRTAAEVGFTAFSLPGLSGSMVFPVVYGELFTAGCLPEGGSNKTSFGIDALGWYGPLLIGDQAIDFTVTTTADGSSHTTGNCNTYAHDSFVRFRATMTYYVNSP